jgi:predicted aminopeptidase
VWPLLFASVTTLAGPFGIDIGYYTHLGVGQWRLIWSQVPVQDVIEDADTDPVIRERLKLAEQIRSYAIDELGLEGSDNYTTYCDIGDGPAVWALTVAPPDELEPFRWSYPVIGSAPYRGFFDRKRAEREQNRFQEKGYDTVLRGVSAFSTLGWFRDPILSSVLRTSAIDLADVLIHELTHATVWIEGDADFNESLATFVGREGAKTWVVHHFEGGLDSLAATERRRSDRRIYRTLMHGLAARLDSTYSLDIPKDEKLASKKAQIASARARAATFSWKTEEYRSQDSWTINNATLALFRTYNRKSDVFARVLAKAGNLKAALRVFERCEGQRDPEAYLERWLEKTTTSE